MDLKQTILSYGKTHKTFSSSDIVGAVHNTFTRQYVAKTLSLLVREGKLLKAGTTKTTLYALPEWGLLLEPEFEKMYKIKQLDEDLVLQEVSIQLPGYSRLPELVTKLFAYAFTEMVNNSIEHSSSPTVRVTVQLTQSTLSFTVEDSGVGVFHHIQMNKQLNSELEAIQDLLKGKTTTKPAFHSGEGIFFTSKTPDVFLLESHDHLLRIDNTLNDVFIVPSHKYIQGTRVYWTIALDTKKELQHIFQAYQSSPDTFQFDKTKVTVKLYTVETEYVSRSQARRLLVGLDKFKTIVLDFDKVKTIGQGFADEIFRVFPSHYPEIILESIHASEEVQAMIDHTNPAVYTK